MPTKTPWHARQPAGVNVGLVGTDRAIRRVGMSKVSIHNCRVEATEVAGSRGLRAEGAGEMSNAGVDAEAEEGVVLIRSVDA